MSDIRDEEEKYWDAMDRAVEQGWICTECGTMIHHRYQSAPSQCDSCRAAECTCEESDPKHCSIHGDGH